jgi:hypothetical protein
MLLYQNKMKTSKGCKRKKYTHAKSEILHEGQAYHLETSDVDTTISKGG